MGNVAIDSSDQVYLADAGYFTGTDITLVTKSFDFNHGLLWQRNYLVPEANGFGGAKVAAGGGGRVVVCGAYSVPLPPPYRSALADIATLAYTSMGIPLWTNQFFGKEGRVSGLDVIYASSDSIAIDSVGRALVLCSYFDGGVFGSGVTALRCYDPKGLVLWTWSQTNALTTYPGMVKVDSQDRVYALIGVTQEFGRTSRIMRFDTSGRMIWSKTNEMDMDPVQMEVTSDGGAYVCLNPIRMTSPATVIAYTADGARKWAKNLTMEGRSLAIGSEGIVYVTGSYPLNSSRYWAVFALSTSSGAALWDHKILPYDNAPDSANTVVTDSNGNAVVTGNSGGVPQITYSIAYTPNGTMLWSNTIPMSSAGIRGSGVVDSHGNAYVNPSQSSQQVWVFPPVLFIEQQPASQSVPFGSAVQFSTRVSGVAPFSYQWYFESTSLLDETNATLSIPNLSSNRVGNYKVVVSNSYGTVTSSVARLVGVVPPVITTSPASIQIQCGETARLISRGLGVGPLRYQWRKNGEELAGSTNQDLALPWADLNAEGYYDVVVSNIGGSVTSSVAQVKVVAEVAPVFEEGPQSAIVNLGARTRLAARVHSCSPTTYHWFFNGQSVATNASSAYEIPSATLAHAGKYQVIACNASGCSTSSIAQLTVNRPPQVQSIGFLTRRADSLTLTTSDLLYRCSDPDGDSLRVTNISALSVAGNPIVFSKGEVQYTPLAGFVGDDRFNFSVSDGRGGRSLTFAEIFVYESSLPALNQLSISLTPSKVRIQYSGAPDRTYRFQRTFDLGHPVWEDIFEAKAPAHGIIEIGEPPSREASFLRVILKE